MGENHLKSILDAVFNLVPPNEYLDLVRNKLRDNVELVKSYFAGTLRRMLDDIGNDNVVKLPDLFYSILGGLFFRQHLSNGEATTVLQYITTLKAENGFRPMRDFESEWRGQPRIYTTFYSMASLSLIGKLETFLAENGSWCEETLKWITSLQPGDRGGAFVEPDCPKIEVPELSFWALNVISYLHPDLQSIVKDTFSTSKTWLLNFLQQRKTLSATRIFYCLNTLRLFFSDVTLDSDLTSQLIKFIEGLHYDKGFHEFQIKEIKAEYREEKTHEFDLIHSTFFGLMGLKMLGYNSEKYDKFVANAKTLILQSKTVDGEYGVPIQVKDYELLPVKTPFETFCALLILVL